MVWIKSAHSALSRRPAAEPVTADGAHSHGCGSAFSPRFRTLPPAPPAPIPAPIQSAGTLTPPSAPAPSSLTSRLAPQGLASASSGTSCSPNPTHPDEAPSSP